MPSICTVVSLRLQRPATVVIKALCSRWQRYVFCAGVQGLAQDADKYKAAAAHVELSKKMHKRDPATAPVVGDRVPYVIIKVSFLTSTVMLLKAKLRNSMCNGAGYAKHIACL